MKSSSSLITTKKGSPPSELQHLQTALNQERALRLSLEERIKNTDLFIRGGIHGLRNSALHLLAYSDLLSKYPEGEKRDRALSTIRDAALDLKSLLQHISDFRQIHFSKMEPEYCHLEKELSWVTEQVRAELSDKPFVLNVDFAGDPTAKIIKSHLQHLLTALIRNAVQYTPNLKPVPIHVFMTHKPGYLSFTVRDKGMGMDLEQFGEQAFAPFKKLSTISDGPGLGLATVQSIVQQYRGHIQIDSKPQKGTTITTLLQIPD